MKHVLLVKILLALLLSAGVFLILPFTNHPYRFVEENENLITYNMSPDLVRFVDFDQDGTDEIFTLLKVKIRDSYSMQLLSQNHQVLSQINLKAQSKRWLYSTTFADIDQNDTLEALVFSVTENIVMLEVIDVFADNSAGIRTFILDSLSPGADANIIAFHQQQFIDFNHNGSKDLIIPIKGEYEQSHYRKIFGLDLATGEIISNSPALGNVFNNIVTGDFDGDGEPEITGSIGASGNLPDTLPLLEHDQTAWFLTLERDLKLDTIIQTWPGPYTDVLLIQNLNDSNALVGYRFHRGNLGLANVLFTYDAENGLQDIDTLITQKEGFSTFKSINYEDFKGYMAGSLNGDIMVFDEKLRRVFQTSLSANVSMDFIFADLDRNGQPEFYFKHMKEPILVAVDLNGRVKSVSQEFPDGYNEVICLRTNQDRQHIILRKENSYLPVRYERNPAYYTRWLVLAGLFAIFYLALSLAILAQKRSAMKRQSLVDQMTRLQIQSIKNQVEPHFLFNSLNVLRYLSHEKDHEGIDVFTGHLAGMMRKMLEFSDQPRIKLSDELLFVEHYVSMQKLRHNVELAYEINISEDINPGMFIPKMMLHTHVDNAIKHGILPKGEGTIEISISQLSQQTVITITDNGVGRKEPKRTESTGKGLKVLTELYDIYDQLYSIRITQEITDLYDDQGAPSGTRVSIRL